MCSGDMCPSDHRVVGVGDLQLLGESRHLPSGQRWNVGADGEGGPRMVPDVPHHAEHDETLEPTGERVVAPGVVRKPDGPGKGVQVDQRAVRLADDFVTAPAQEPHGGGSEDSQPEHLHVGAANGVARSIRKRIGPTDEGDDPVVGEGEG